MDHAKRVRRLWALALIAMFSAATWRSAAQSTQREVENVAAFTRVYGVIRFFYPGDAAANADWNRLAVDGVARVRTAPDSTALVARLRDIFEPLGPVIEIASSLPAFRVPAPTTEPLVAWRYFGPGATTAIRGNPYRAKRTDRTPPSRVVPDGFAGFAQSVAARELRGTSVRLRGHVRAAASDTQSGGALWLRVDRADRGIGCFDNMMNRLVREATWREYVIQCDVADDATDIAFGVMAIGGATADFDALDLSFAAAGSAWRAVPIADGGFEAESGTAWSRAGSLDAQITRVAEDAPEGRQFVRFTPRTELAGSATAEIIPEAPPVLGDHIDLDLAGGLHARVALTLTDAQAKAGGSPTPETLPASDRDRRLADIVVAWNVYRHFYPYFADAAVEWDALLGSQLMRAYDASTRAAQADALRRLVADARDGHGTVTDAHQRPRATIPVQVAFIDSRLVVVASRAPAVPVGSVMTAVDGRSATDRFVAAMPLVSGSLQWRQYRAAQDVAACTSTTARITLDDRGETRTVEAPCETASLPLEARPAPIAEVRPGIWYVDLTRARRADLTPKIDMLATARGVIFDVRGYPTDAGAWVLRHLLDTPETDRWMHIAKIVGPFGQVAGWESVGWDLTPAAPRLAGQVVFLTDGRAISYAESVMGYIAGRHLATIVGSPTAGTNGNIATFQVPGEFTIVFTGMRVTGHDGLAVHHLVGVKPDVAASPTLAGIRAGRDEVLDRALSLMR
jgi:hypothetical protein